MNRRPVGFCLATALLVTLAAAGPAISDWSQDPASRTLACNAQFRQYAPRLVKVKDGVILTWNDQRRENTHVDLYGQKFSLYGDARGPDNGRVIGEGPAGALTYSNQESAGLLPGGSGGALIAWNDRNSAGYAQAFATKITADAVVSWGDPGEPIQLPDTAVSLMLNPTPGTNNLPSAWRITQDSEGGFFAPLQAGIGRYDSSGGLRTEWFATQSDQRHALHTIPMIPVLDAEDRDGVITIWPRGDLYFSNSILARKLIDPETEWPTAPDTLIDAWGSVTVLDPAPLANIQVCRIRAVSDGAGGAIAVWIDNRVRDDSGAYYRVYAQRIDDGGLVTWPDGGAGISGDLFKNSCYWWSKLYAAEDGEGGVVIAWNDIENNQRAQRLDADGFALWENGGVIVAHSAAGMTTHGLIRAGDGNFIVLYHHGADERLVAQSLDPVSGEPAWGVGKTVYHGCFSAYYDEAVMVSDGYAGAIVAWPACDSDLYIHRVLGEDSVVFENGFE